MYARGWVRVARVPWLILSRASQEFARSEGIEYIETSAKNSTNVETMFRQIAVDIRQRVESSLSGAAGGAQADGLRVGSQESAAKGCC